MTPMEFGLQYPQIEEGTSKDVWVAGTGDSGNPSRLFYIIVLKDILGNRC